MKDDFDISKLEKKKGKRINSKVKGNKFERDIATLLNTRFNTTDFCRTPGSGAFATTHKLPEHLKVYGDLITPKDFRFIFECKFGYEKFKFIDLLEQDSDISKIISKSREEASRCGKLLLIILKNNYRSAVAITNDIELDKEKLEIITYKDLRIIRLNELLALPDRCFYSK